MLIVIDANILFAALIARKKALDLCFHPSLEILSPYFIMEEYKEHLEEISKKAKITSTEAMTFIILITQRIKLVDVQEYQEFLKEAKTLTPDQDDIDYLALALKYNCPLWSEDEEMTRQKKVKVYTTKELLEMFEAR